jgi:hypothetical protein
MIMRGNFIPMIHGTVEVLSQYLVIIQVRLLIHVDGI